MIRVGEFCLSCFILFFEPTWSEVTLQEAASLSNLESLVFLFIQAFCFSAPLTLSDILKMEAEMCSNLSDSPCALSLSLYVRAVGLHR